MTNLKVCGTKCSYRNFR